MESLTLLPPSDSPHLHPCASHAPATHSLQRPDASIAEEEEEDDGEPRKEEELQEEDGSPTDETETDATVKESTTTELVTPTDEAPEVPEGGDEPEGEDTLLEVNRDQESCDLSATEKTEDAETRSETPDSPELD